MRKLSAALVAVLFSACAYAASMSQLPPSQPIDPSQITGTINTLIQSINSGVAGLISSSPVQATTTGTTIQTLGTGTIPGGALTIAGQAVRAKCFGSGTAVAALNTLTIQVGSAAAFAVPGTASTAGAFTADVIVMKTGANTQQILSKGQFAAAPATQTIVAAANNDTNPISIVCSGTSTTAGSFTLNGLIVEQIK